MIQEYPSCEERIEAHMQGRLEDLEKLLELDSEEYDEDIGNIYEYGLCLCYIAEEDTHNGRGFIRYQLSTGGPGDELRYFVDWQGKVYKVEYWFLDWFDGASRTLTGSNLETALNAWEYLYMENVLPR